MDTQGFVPGSQYLSRWLAGTTTPLSGAKHTRLEHPHPSQCGCLNDVEQGTGSEVVTEMTFTEWSP